MGLRNSRGGEQFSEGLKNFGRVEIFSGGVEILFGRDSHFFGDGGGGLRNIEGG